jgi:hypothetical protein
MPGTYTAPEVTDDKITPSFVRDQLIECFESANGEFAKLLDQPATEEEIRVQVRAFVEGVFSQCGVSYSEPTKDGILTAIAECKSKAEMMMGPKGASIIEHHYHEMTKLVNRLPG